jgi:hypothetical protein
MSPTMANTPDSTSKDLAARLDEIASLRAAIDRQFGNAVKQPPASEPPPARRRQEPLQFVAAKAPIDDGNEGSPE